MPDTIKVGCHVYTVVRSPLPDCLGDCDFDALRIRVRPRLRKSKAQETLLHEVLHACTDPSLKAGKHAEEDFIETASPILLQVIQDNPGLLAYLQEPATRTSR
jgi:hypothetical protein